MSSYDFSRTMRTICLINSPKIKPNFKRGKKLPKLSKIMLKSKLFSCKLQDEKSLQVSVAFDRISCCWLKWPDKKETKKGDVRCLHSTNW